MSTAKYDVALFDLWIIFIRIVLVVLGNVYSSFGRGWLSLVFRGKMDISIVHHSKTVAHHFFPLKMYTSVQPRFLFSSSDNIHLRVLNTKLCVFPRQGM